MEVSEAGREEKADALASLMKEKAGDRPGVTITRPTRRVDLCIRGVGAGTPVEGVRAAIASAGGCPLGDVRIGEIRTSPRGLGTVWVSCPVVVAKKVAAAGRLSVGWISATVELLPLPRVRALEAVMHRGD